MVAECFYDVRFVQNHQVCKRTLGDPELNKIYRLCRVDRDHIIDLFDFFAFIIQRR